MRQFLPPPWYAPGMRVTSLALVAMVAVAGSHPALAAVTYLGPQPYNSALDSPFHYLPHSYFYLEDFEDNALNTPGVTSAAGLAFTNGSSTDSVDKDDGVIDGNGKNGHSYWSAYSPLAFTFTFSAAVLGSLPTMAGLVWTDVGQVSSGTPNYGNVMFEAFDQNGVSLGAIGPFAVGDGENTGQTAEDRFFGVEYDGGISKIKMWMTNSTDFEVDHLQYGGADLTGVQPAAVPALRVGNPFPNPSAGNVSVSVRNTGSLVSANVYDVSGRLVRTLHTSGAGALLSWDARDNHGVLVPSGVYFLDVRDGRGADVRRRVSILR
ncbi:MAG TPA: T9SS type A sorting domain-containing protein [Candidatus Krumholzibacteria bacterium]|nr:T9SS type A sorting domain-containing protein [Candidatus Krumholzibacteria bacterium]